MSEPPRTASSAAGSVSIALGVLALALYGLLGTAGEGVADVPGSRFILAALLVATGSLLHTGRGPRWTVYVAAGLAGLITVDIVLMLV
ncbi:MAG: hypothetical protein AAF845_08775 [Bacteroidota bacterium]